jgi:hypothetical protein
MMVAMLAAVSVAQADAEWRAFAACAAAYEVNAQVADPDRPASMRAMVSEVANDYRRAAEDAYRGAAKASAAQAREAVAAEVARRTAVFRPKPRTDVEKVIDACPQLPEDSG